MSSKTCTKLRLVVLTDISTLTADSGEPDDTQSLVRLLLYANQFDIEGLIATHTQHGDVVKPGYIEAIIDRYAQVRPNLVLHDADYPDPSRLLACVRGGHRDRDHVGARKDSPGSDLILDLLGRQDLRPVWLIVWGGTRELAQALWRAQGELPPAEFAALKRRIRVRAIDDQDATGQWIKHNHPDVFYVTSYPSHRGMYRGGEVSLVTPEWVEEHIRVGHGALGAAYPNYDGGDPWGRVYGIKEGDTPSLLYLLRNGLNEPEEPSWGGWGGRFQGDGTPFTDAPIPGLGKYSERATVYRWRRAYQADFQARLDWCVRPPSEVNHAPMAAIAGSRTRRVSPGAAVELDGSASFDPDGDMLTYQWWFYREPSTFRGLVSIEGSESASASLVAPEVGRPETLHIVLTVTDSGQPPLRGYARCVLIVDPGA